MIQLEAYRNLDLRDLIGEIWKDILGYETMYQVSNLGRIKSFLRAPRILKQWYNGKNSPTVVLSSDGIRSSRHVADIVGRTFIGSPNRDQNEVFVHLNKIQSDNRVVNLSIKTKSVSKLLNYHLGVEVDWGIKNVGIATRFVNQIIYIGEDKQGNKLEFKYKELLERYGLGGINSIYRCIAKKKNFNTAYGRIWTKKLI